MWTEVKPLSCFTRQEIDKKGLVLNFRLIKWFLSLPCMFHQIIILKLLFVSHWISNWNYCVKIFKSRNSYIICRARGPWDTSLTLVTMKVHFLKLYNFSNCKIYKLGGGKGGNTDLKKRYSQHFICKLGCFHTYIAKKKCLSFFEKRFLRWFLYWILNTSYDPIENWRVPYYLFRVKGWNI